MFVSNTIRGPRQQRGRRGPRNNNGQRHGFYGDWLDLVPFLNDVVGDHVDDQGGVELIEEISDPVIEEDSDLALEEVSDPVIEDISDPVVEEVDDPVIEDVSDPVSEPVSEPISEPISENVDVPTNVINVIHQNNNTLTLQQIEQLIQQYMLNINSNNTTNTYIDNSINQTQSYADNSVQNINIDNSTNIANTDNSVNTVNDNVGNNYSDNSVNNSNNSTVNNISNSFELKTYDIALGEIITGERGPRRGWEPVRGTNGDDVIGDGDGKDRLIGRGGADSFVFDEFDKFGKRHADVIKDFRPRQGDLILLDSEEFDEEATLGVAKNKKEFKQLKAGGDFDVIYFQPRGCLFYNENGDERGFGDGGLFAKLGNKVDLTPENLGLLE